MIVVPDPIPALKQRLADEITRLLAHYNQGFAACMLGLEQPRMSELLSGKLNRFGVQRLIRLLANLDRRVELTIVQPADPRIRLTQQFWHRVERTRRPRTSKPRRRASDATRAAAW
jgi:predicted XRE-type DNA-binding protein